MTARDLTQRFVETVRASDDRTEIRDAKVRGLEIRVSCHGTKTWLLRYRRKSDGRKRSITLGRFPEVSLQEARLSAIEQKAIIGRGADPAGSAAESRTAMTFRELAEHRLQVDPNIGDGTRRAYKQSLNGNVFSEIGDVTASRVTADEIARILDKIECRGALVQADRTRAAIGSTFKWAVKRRVGGVLTDPTIGLGKRAPSTRRTRVLSIEELCRFLAVLQDPDAPLSESMKLIFEIALLTGQRRSEVAGAKLVEVKLTGELPVWTIPGDSKRNGIYVRGRTKNRQEQLLPLSMQSLARFKKAAALAHEGDHFFPGEQSRDGSKRRLPHIHGESVTRAMRRLREKYAFQDITIHDLRRTMATWLGDHGTRPDVIDHILNHQPRDVTRRHYNHAKMDTLVRAAMQDWADHLSKLA